jgi:xanthosine utilization system XapX-like protein
MRYTKIALLTFGAGLVIGLVVVVVEINRLARFASGLMALGLAGIPFGMIVDWRLATKAVQKPAKKSVKTPTRRNAATTPTRRNAAAQPRRTPRPRKPTPPKR